MVDLDNKLNQVFYCTKTISESTSLIALRCKNYGIIFSKGNPNVLTEDCRMISRLFIINSKIGIAGTGLYSDLKKIVKRARREACIFKNNFGEEISCKELAREIGAYIQSFTQSNYFRVLGVSLFLIGFDSSGPVLYQVNPAGLFLKIKGGAIGKYSNSIIKMLRKRLSDNLELSDLCNISKIIAQEILELTSKITIDVIIASGKSELKILSYNQVKTLFKAQH